MMGIQEAGAAGWNGQHQRTPERVPFFRANQPQTQQSVPSENAGAAGPGLHPHHGHGPPSAKTDGGPRNQAQAPAPAPSSGETARVPQLESEMPAHHHHHNQEDHHHHHHHHHGHQAGSSGPIQRDEKVTSALHHLTQLRKTPSYLTCEFDTDLEFLNVCHPKPREGTRAETRILNLPEIPCLQKDDIDNLIRCEKRDVESALYLVSDERKTYKKPCPKQQKAQMNVKALVQGHGGGQICGKEYPPLEHPDPDDISPDVAATMVFCQERGIELVGCPKYAINYLFPEEPRPPFPEKIPPDNVSVVDPEQAHREMMERSAAVPSDGVCDSAYTRTMRGKGEDLGPQRSYDVDFAVGQAKREYVFVAEKPQRINMAQFRGGGSPPWFPGYFSAFPDEDGGLKLVASPSKLFHKAWAHSKPANIPTSDVIVLD